MTAKCIYVICNYVVTYLSLHMSHILMTRQMCQPFYGSNNVKILAYCLFYFIPTLVLMQCYGSIFHSKRMQAMRRATKSVSNLNQHASIAVEGQGETLRTLAFILLAERIVSKLFNQAFSQRILGKLTNTYFK